MKKFLILLFFCLPTYAAQEIQQSSIDFLLSRPETLDILTHVQTWRFTSLTDGKTYTAIRYVAVAIDGSKTRYCLIEPEGAFSFPVTHIGYWNFTYFLTNGQNMDLSISNWCTQ